MIITNVPDVVHAWLAEHQRDIAVDPPEADGRPDQPAVYAQWDPGRQRLHLGWWGELRCPGCGQDRLRPTDELVVPEGFTALDRRHRCGGTWAPRQSVADLADLDLSSREGPDAAVVTGRLRAALAAMRAIQQDRLADLRAELAEQLRQVLAEPEGRRQPTGSPDQPGVWLHPELGWQAWAYNPVTFEPVVVHAEHAAAT